MESPGGSRLSLKDCSPGKGPRWSRETCEEGGAAERGWDGRSATPIPTPCAPRGERSREGRGEAGTGGKRVEGRCCFHLSFFSPLDLF